MDSWRQLSEISGLFDEAKLIVRPLVVILQGSKNRVNDGASLQGGVERASVSDAGSTPPGS